MSVRVQTLLHGTMPSLVGNACRSGNWRIHWKTREQDPMRREKMERAEDRTRANDPSTAIRADPLNPRSSALKPFATAPYPRAASIPAQHCRWHRTGDRLDIRKSVNNTLCAVRNGSPTRIAPLRPTRGYSPFARRPPSRHHSQICRPIPGPFARPASIAVENILRRAHTDPIIQGLGATRFVGR